MTLQRNSKPSGTRKRRKPLPNVIAVLVEAYLRTGQQIWLDWLDMYAGRGSLPARMQKLWKDHGHDEGAEA